MTGALTVDRPPDVAALDGASRAIQQDEATRVARAVESLVSIYEDIASHVDAHAGERCPYRTAHDLCSFEGGCQNQRRAADDAPGAACGGDGRLRWEAPERSLEPEAWSPEPGA